MPSDDLLDDLDEFHESGEDTDTGQNITRVLPCVPDELDHLPTVDDILDNEDNPYGLCNNVPYSPDITNFAAPVSIKRKHPRWHKTLIIVLICMAITVITGFGVCSAYSRYQYLEEQKAVQTEKAKQAAEERKAAADKKKRLKAELDDTVLVAADTLARDDQGKYIIEYGSEAPAATDLFSASVEGVTLTSDDIIDTSKVGDVRLTYTAKNAAGSRTLTQTICVRDSKTPVVNLKAATITVSHSGTLDPTENISVTDVVDGDITYVDDKPEAIGSYDGKDLYEAGWYILTAYDSSNSSVDAIDTSHGGTYNVKISGADKNGNTFEAHFTIVVEAAPPTTQPAPSQQTSTLSESQTQTTDDSSHTTTDSSEETSRDTTEQTHE